MKKEEQAEEEAGLGSEQVSQVLYIHPVGVYPLSLCVSFLGGGSDDSSVPGSCKHR